MRVKHIIIRRYEDRIVFIDYDSIHDLYLIILGDCQSNDRGIYLLNKNLIDSMSV